MKRLYSLVFQARLTSDHSQPFPAWDVTCDCFTPRLGTHAPSPATNTTAAPAPNFVLGRLLVVAEDAPGAIGAAHSTVMNRRYEGVCPREVRIISATPGQDVDAVAI
jgi:hypothetical protein